MAVKYASRPRVAIRHPRAPEPSTAYLWAVLDGQRETVVEIPLTEADCYVLAEEALTVASVLRKVRLTDVVE